MKQDNPEKLKASAEGLGITPPPEWFQREPPKPFQVWPENWPAVELFLRCQTQWRLGPYGRVGLDYPAVLAMARLYRAKAIPATMEDLQAIEFTILSEV